MRNKFIFAILILPILASGHTHVKSSNPAKDSVVHSSPKVVEIQFSENLETAMSTIEVKNSKTKEIVSEKKEDSNSSQKELKTNLKNLKNEKALYQVSWKAVSKDGHTMKGSYDFTFDPAKK